VGHSCKYDWPYLSRLTALDIFAPSSFHNEGGCCLDDPKSYDTVGLQGVQMSHSEIQLEQEA